MCDKENQRYYFIMNPGSKGGNSGKRLEAIHGLLSRTGIDYDYCVTKSLADAFEMSVKANLNGYGTIVAVGGDGTINRVINGFYDKDGVRLSNAKFGVIYTGTSPDFCKSYNIPLDTEKAVDILTKGNSRPVGTGRIEFEDKVKYFACCANIGLGAELARNANGGVRKIFGDTAGTFLALIKTLCTYKPIDITLNGRELAHIYNISVGKTYYVASGLKIKNKLDIADERFYVLKIQGKLLSLMRKMYGGSELELDYESKITVTGCGEVEFDGDEGGQLPCIITPAEHLEVIYDRERIN